MFRATEQMKLPNLSNRAILLIGVGLVFVIFFVLRANTRRREGFQATPTMPPEFKLEVPKLDVPENVAPQTCGILLVLLENLNNQMKSASESSNKMLKGLLAPSIREVEGQIRDLKCAELAAPSGTA